MKTTHQPLSLRLGYAYYHLGHCSAMAKAALTDALAWLAWRIWGPLFTSAWRQGIRLDAHRPFHNSPVRHAPVLTETNMPNPHPNRRTWRRFVP